VTVSADSTLMRPYALGPVPLRNRVFLPAHTTNFALDNLPTSRNADYLAARARGGVGLIITEAIRVHPSSAGRHISLGSFDDASVPAYEALVDAVHDGGARIFAQIMHLGRQANGDATRTAAWGASPLPWARGALAPHTMGERDIRTVVDAFAAAARRMRAAGFDGIELHAGHGHLIQQFLSPATNARTDAYGGSPEKRLRFAREVLEAVTSAVPGLPVGLRVSVAEFSPGGMEPHDTLAVLDQLLGEFRLTYVHASHSAYQSGYALSTQMADMHFAQAPFIEHARLVKEAFPHVPVLAVCRIDTLEKAAEIVDAGTADMVGLARPHIADPELVNKALDGATGTVTSCLACNQACIGRVELNLPISCVVNPEVGEERLWERVRHEHEVPGHMGPSVLVVGGGPAGMKAALSAHRSGARVVLAEARPALGGQVPAAASVGGRDRLRLATDELARDLMATDVEVRLGTRVSADDVTAEAFDHVIVATGSVAAKRSWAGTVPVVDVDEALSLVASGELPTSGRVVVIDGEGTWAAASLTEEIAGRGLRVDLVSPLPSLFARITTYTKANLLDRLSRLPVGMHLMVDATEVTDAHVVLTHTVTGDTQVLDDVTLVVDLCPPVSDDALFRALESSPVGLDVVGDASSPRTVLEAIYEGHRAGTTVTRHDRAAVSRPEPVA
jgi:2,4-dienoyl-CoA reductase-like NADH-dependent reductase (Old Yellow Enzyme family)/thioredoxin reductase